MLAPTQVLAVPPAAAPKAPGRSPKKPPPPKQSLLVAAVVDPSKRQMEDVYAAVSRALARGLEVGQRAANSGPGTQQSGCVKRPAPIFKFDDVKTYDELVQGGRAESQINKYVALSDESVRALVAEKKFAGYIGIQVIRTEGGSSLYVWMIGNGPRGDIQEFDRRTITRNLARKRSETSPNGTRLVKAPWDLESPYELATRRWFGDHRPECTARGLGTSSMRNIFACCDAHV